MNKYQEKLRRLKMNMKSKITHQRKIWINKKKKLKS